MVTSSETPPPPIASLDPAHLDVFRLMYPGLKAHSALTRIVISRLPSHRDNATLRYGLQLGFG